MPATEIKSALSSFPLILLVEDSPDDAYFFQRALDKLPTKYAFKHVFDGEAAVELVSCAYSGGDKMPDAIFLDLKMPVMNGFEVLEWLQQQSWTDSLNITVLSGSNQQNDLEKAQRLGASGYLVKPITSKDLELTLQALRK